MQNREQKQKGDGLTVPCRRWTGGHVGRVGAEIRVARVRVGVVQRIIVHWKRICTQGPWVLGRGKNSLVLRCCDSRVRGADRIWLAVMSHAGQPLLLDLHEG